MGKTYEEISPAHAAWIGEQRMFFVATSPLAAEGHINCSPKGLDSFRVLGPRTVAYLDLVGSGAETIAHVRENGRIVFLFCAFAGAPKILRLHGRGEVILPEAPEWAELRPQFPDHPGARAILRVEVTRVSDSCGFGVPELAFEDERNTLLRWAESKGDEGIEVYKRQKNRRSIDGLPALDSVAE